MPTGSFDDCPDCLGAGLRHGDCDCDCGPCQGTGQVQDQSDDVCDALLSAPDDDVLSGKFDGIADGTHFLDRDGIVRPKTR